MDVAEQSISTIETMPVCSGPLLVPATGWVERVISSGPWRTRSDEGCTPPLLLPSCHVSCGPRYERYFEPAVGWALCWSILDFFPTSIQRLALRTVANLCLRASPEHEVSLLDSVPTPSNLMSHGDSKIVDSAVLALTRTLESLLEASGKHYTHPPDS